MKASNKPEIKKKLEFNDESLKFINFKNYIIAISRDFQKIDFYDVNDSLKKSFNIEFIQDTSYDKWKIYFTKDKQLFLIGYFNEFKDFFVFKENRNLGIYLLNIEKRTIEKKTSFNYKYFVENQKDDKLYIVDDEVLIAYDFKSNTQIEKKEKILNKEKAKKFVFVDDYLLLLNMVAIHKWLYSIDEVIFIDKNFEKIIKKTTNDPFEDGAYYLDFEYYDCFGNFQKDFQRISDNLFFTGSADNSEKFVTIKFKKENILNEGGNNVWEELFDEPEIYVNSNQDNISLYILDHKRFLLNFNNNIFYLYNLNDLKIITKMEVNLQKKNIVKKGQLLLCKIRGIYYDLYYVSQNNELLYITNKLS